MIASASLNTKQHARSVRRSSALRQPHQYISLSVPSCHSSIAETCAHLQLIAACDLVKALQEPAPPGAGLHELNMLAQLIKQPKAQQASNFKLNLFASSPQPAGEFGLCTVCLRAEFDNAATCAGPYDSRLRNWLLRCVC